MCLSKLSWLWCYIVNPHSLAGFVAVVVILPITCISNECFFINPAFNGVFASAVDRYAAFVFNNDSAGWCYVSSTDCTLQPIDVHVTLGVLQGGRCRGGHGGRPHCGCGPGSLSG